MGYQEISHLITCCLKGAMSFMHLREFTTLLVNFQASLSMANCIQKKADEVHSPLSKEFLPTKNNVNMD
jgi:hypothetical protein